MNGINQKFYFSDETQAMFYNPFFIILVIALILGENILSNLFQKWSGDPYPLI